MCALLGCLLHEATEDQRLAVATDAEQDVIQEVVQVQLERSEERLVVVECCCCRIRRGAVTTLERPQVIHGGDKELDQRIHFLHHVQLLDNLQDVAIAEQGLKKGGGREKVKFQYF